jgi:hypothetical protein
MSVAPDQSLAIVPSPQAAPPVTGLISTLAALGADQYLVDDTGIVIDGLTNRWEMGYGYNPEQTCQVGAMDDPCSLTENMDPPGNPTNVVEIPGLIWAGDTCSSFGFSARDYRGRAQRALIAGESYIIAREFWTGLRATAAGWPNTFLAEAGTPVVGGGPFSVSAALGVLEQAIADTANGQPGVIHCSRQLGSAFSELGNTFRQVGTGIIQTYLGTVIVADAGYPGTGPGNAAPGAGEQWAYATLIPTVRRSPIEVIPDTFEEATDRALNSISFRAERIAGVTIPPCTLIGVPVSLGLPVIP